MSTGKAFTNPSEAKVAQQRKILEELESQKKQIKTSNPGSNISDQSLMLPAAQVTSSSVVPNMISSTQTPSTAVGNQVTVPQSLSVSSNTPIDNVQSNQQLSSNQRKALEEANKTSFGYFITQDSSFGNLILPVIPRIPPQPNNVPTPVTTTLLSTINPYLLT